MNLNWIWGCDIFPEWMRLVLGVKSSLCRWWGPSRGGFLAVESRNLWSYNSSAALPSSAGPQETHTHSHTCMYTHLFFFFLLCYTFSIFSLSLPSPSSSCMRFPDVFSVSSLSQCSQQIKAATARRASSFWTLWPLTCLMFEAVKVEGHRAVRADRKSVV